MRKFMPLVLAAVLWAFAPASVSAQDPNDGCGGLNQVPCYVWSWEIFWFKPIGPYNGCDNSRLNNIGLVCVPCGGDWQSACRYKPQCNPGYRNVLGVCRWSGYSEEPSTNVSSLPLLTQPPDEPVRGIADIHSHQFANLGFGGVVFWGSSFDWRGINSALAWCDYTWDFATRSMLGFNLAPTWTLGYAVHGPIETQWYDHPVSMGVNEGAGGTTGAHAVGGTGPFDGWPTFRTMTHQQMYYKWLERAYQGGVRLSVMLAVSNESMCKGSKVRRGWNCDDMPAVDRQLQAAKELEAAVDWFDDRQFNRSGWYQIAYTPADARRIIRNGKMAVVLGIEVDSLFGCKPNAGCTRAFVLAEMKRYYGLGVRHVYPIHQFDNAFGGAALFKNLLNTGNQIVTGQHFAVRDCYDEGYRYNVEPDALIEFFAGFMLGQDLPNPAYYRQFPADCNARGLTALGRQAITDMMDNRFIIDIDHMSRLMMTDVLQMAVDREPDYPLVSGHTTFFSRAPTGARTEFSLKDSDVEILKRIGGMLTATTLPPQSCWSSRGYAANYRFAVDSMKGGPYREGYEAVAFSTDFGGWGGQTGPRFGWADCPDPVSPPNPLQYPFTGLFGGSFGRQITGTRAFDFNTDGLAHVGLVPDLIADLQTIGVTGEELTPLYNSAETYIRMWERINQADEPRITPQITGTFVNGWYTDDVTIEWNVEAVHPNTNPVISYEGCGRTVVDADTTGTEYTCTASTATASGSASVTIRRDATPPVLGETVRSVEPGTWTNHDVTVTFHASDAGSGIDGASEVEVVLTGEGVDEQAVHTFTDLAGNSIVASLGGFKIDRTPPVITFTFAALPEDAPEDAQDAERRRWHNAPVVLRVRAEDELSGVRSMPPDTLLLTGEGADVRGTATAVDEAGNTATGESFGVKIDLTAPTIAFVSRLPLANANGWNNTDVVVSWSCVDTMSGPEAESVSDVRAQEGFAQVAAGTCRDVAGKTASATHGGINIDKTPPSITPSVEPPANAAGWHNTDVTLAFSATDVLSGIDPPTVAVVTFTADGANQGATRGFADRAGNQAALTHGGIHIDKTPPVLGCAAAPDVLWPANHKLVPIAVEFRFTDTMSGPRDYAIVAAGSSEPDNGLGDGDTPGDMVGFVVGTSALKGALRAERSGQSTAGRIYTLGYRGSDLAGNAASCSTTVAVPHDRGTRR